MRKQLSALFLALSATLTLAAVDVNQASVDDLVTIKGIGPATASRILDARQQGDFKSWSDLIERVKGIAPASANKLSEAGLTVNGQTYPILSAPPAPAAAPDTTAQKSVKPAQTAGKKQEKP